MKVLAIIVLCGIFAVISSSHADVDPVTHLSHNGAFAIKNVGDTANPDHHFQIVNSKGDLLLSSDNHPDLGAGSFAESIRWSPDNRYVAFSVRTSGPYIRNTFVYSTRLNRLLRVGTDDADYQTNPVRWFNAQRLIVQTEGPVGGKATEEKESDSYRYRRTLRFSENPFRYETLYTTKR